MSAVDEALKLTGAGDYIGADHLLAQHLQQQPDDAEAWYVRAHINLNAEIPDAALAFIAQAITHRPEEPTFYVLAGDAALLQGDADKAGSFYMHGLRHAQGDLAILLRLFAILLLRSSTQRDLMPAITQIVGQLHQQELDAAACAEIANAFASAGEATEAMTWFERAASKAGDVSLKNRYRLEVACLLHDPAMITERLGYFTAEDAKRGMGLWESINTPPPAIGKPGLTCVVTTNLTKKLVVNANKAPPKLDLIADTLASWRANMQPGPDTRVVIYFDQPKAAEPDDKAYADALGDYCGKLGYQLELRRGAGLKANVMDALGKCETSYFTLLEHDFLFHNTPPQNDLMDLMQQHDFLHLVQFNRRPNVSTRWDTHMWPETRITSHALLRTPRFSNNPYVARTGKLMRDFLPIFSNPNTFDGTNSGAGGLEEQVKVYIAQLVGKYGFGFAQKWSGYCLYGAPLDAPRLTHTGI